MWANINNSMQFKKKMTTFLSKVLQEYRDHNNINSVTLYVKVTQENLRLWPLSEVALYIQGKNVCTFH